MRANASALLGIFSAYQSVKHDALILHANAPEEVTRRFLDLVGNLYYQKLAEEMHMLGFLKTAVRQIPKINKMVRAVFDNTAGKKIADMGSKAITIGTGFPLPDSSFAEALLANRYLPPIVDLQSTLARAKENFVKHGNIEGIVGLRPKISKRSP
jgi:hypothetical protein